MTATHTTSDCCVALPPERFYWCEMRDSPWRGTGQLPIGLMPTLADEVPIDTELLHAVGAPASDGSLVVCAMLRDELDTLGAGLLSLTPSALPAGPDAVGVNPGSLELLVGDFEPRALRRVRTVRSAVYMLAIALCSVAISLGFHSRASETRELARLASTELASINTTFVGDTLNARRALQEALSRTPVPRDIADDLAHLLASWPIEQGQLKSVSVTNDQVNIAATTEGDPSSLIAAVRAPAGWVVDEPRFTSAGSLARISVSMRPMGKDTPPGTGGKP